MSKMDKNKEQSTGVSPGKAIKETCYFLTILFCVLRASGIIAFAAIEDDD